MGGAGYGGLVDRGRACRTRDTNVILEARGKNPVTGTPSISSTVSAREDIVMINVKGEPAHRSSAA